VVNNAGLGDLHLDQNFVDRALDSSHFIAAAMTTTPQSYYCGIYQSHDQYVESGYGWKCTLCDVNLRKVDVDQHVKELHHHHHVQKLAFSGIYVTSALDRWTDIVSLESRLTELEHTKWQLNVKGLLFDYLWAGDATILQKSETSLSLYEHMGRLSLLELAVWKAACISQVEFDSKTSMKTLHDVILCAAKHQDAWKEYRTETRKSNSIEIIIKQVLPFLDKP
jgi:hypothetical protein